MIFDILKRDMICSLDNRIDLNKAIIDNNNYYITENISSGDMANDPSCKVIYRINSDGFRSDHFKKIKNNETSILFGGCSWTFGEGIPEEYTWTRLLTNKIEKKIGTKINYFNTAYMGSSIDLIIRNIMAFIRKYGAPTYIFILFPDMARKVKYDENNKKYVKAFPNPSWLSENDNHVQKKHTIEYIFENNLYDNFNLIYFLEDYCKLHNIKLLWSSWMTAEYEYYQQYKFNSFIIENDGKIPYFDPSCPKESDRDYYENINNLPYWKIAKDNAHPGTAWTHFISNFFFEKGEENEFF